MQVFRVVMTILWALNILMAIGEILTPNKLSDIGTALLKGLINAGFIVWVWHLPGACLR